jgi:hypothetical protein
VLAWPTSHFGLPTRSTSVTRCGRAVTAHNAHGGVLTDDPAVIGRRQGLAREHHGVSGVASGKVRQRGSHRRWPAVVGWRNGLARWRFNGGEGVPVAREGGDRVLQLEEETGDEGRSTVEGDDGQGWDLTEGGSRLRRRLHFRRRRHASGGRSWTGGKGGKVVLVVCLRRRKIGGRKGWVASAVLFNDTAGGRGRRGVRGREAATWRGGNGNGAAVRQCGAAGTGPELMRMGGGTRLYTR